MLSVVLPYREITISIAGNPLQNKALDELCEAKQEIMEIISELALMQVRAATELYGKDDFE
jgi:hypothetical protein